MALTFRTISDLPLVDEPVDGSLFGISVPGGNQGETAKYTSMKIDFSSIRDSIVSSSIIRS